MSRLFALPALGLALGVSLALWWALGRPVALPDVPGGRLECVSYTPWQGRSENPLEHGFVVDEKIIRASLAALKPLTGCIRLYSALDVYPEVVKIADETGIQVMLGMWIGGKDELNEKEIAAALSLAQAYPKTVRMLIVGNEVLLRREMSGNRLAGIIRAVKARTTLPVAYADIPHFWRQNPVVAEAVDVIGIHLLPYWDDPTPTTIDAVQEHLQNLTAAIRREFPGKPLLMAEVGWPSAGRTRGGAVPTIVNEARFVREFTRWADAEKLAYNLIEGWDQPWKKLPEGTVGGFWGVLDRHLDAKFALTGPVSEWPHWRRDALFTATVAGLLLLVPLAAGRRPSVMGWLGLGLLGPAFGATLVGLGFIYETVPSSLFGEIGHAGLFVLTAAATALLALHLMGDAGVAAIRPAPFDTVLAWLRRPRRPDAALLLGLFWWATIGAATLLALAIAFDGRHRDFLTLGFWIPGVVLAVQAARSRPLRPCREEAWMAAILAVAGIFGVDWWGNIEAWAWAATCLLLAAPMLPASRDEALRLGRCLRGREASPAGEE